VLKSDFANSNRSVVRQIINLVNGDMAKELEAVELLNERDAGLFDRYAKRNDYEVEINENGGQVTVS